jgi:hypothetical protein
MNALMLSATTIPARRWRNCFKISLMLVLLLALPGLAAAWEGEEIIKDGIPHLMNPAQAIEPPTTIKLDRLWLVSGDEEEEFFFGVLTEIACDDKGNVYLLDVQLHQVLIFSSTGEYIRSIGRQGEGPGEFNRPSDLFMTAGGDVAVMQTQPGKIILLSPGGEPMGNHPTPEPEDGGMQMFSSGQNAGDRIILFVERFSRRDNGFSITSSLIGVDASGSLKTTYFSQDDSRDFASMSFNEKKMRNNAVTWSAGNDARVYMSNDFDAYQIEVRGPSGAIERVIETAYEHRIRSAEEIERNTPQIRIRGGGHTQSPEVKMSKTDRDIVGLYPREDGTLWVLSSRGAFDAPDGAIATFDIYDKEGKFARPVTLEGDGNFNDDGFHFVKDQFFVIKGMRSARRAMFGGGDSAEDVDDEPISVICYDLRPIIQSQR